MLSVAVRIEEGQRYALRNLLTKDAVHTQVTFTVTRQCSYAFAMIDTLNYMIIIKLCESRIALMSVSDLWLWYRRQF
jgi:hypothetical protein